MPTTVTQSFELPRNASDTPVAFDINMLLRRYPVSRRTVHRWLEQGLPFFQQGPGCKILIKPEDVEMFLRRRVTKPDLNRIVNEAAEAVMRGLTTPPKRFAQRQSAGN